MTREEAIKIIEDECEHIKNHLKCKGKAEDFYKELGDMCIAFYMAIKALEQEPTDRIEYGTDGNAYKLWISNGKEYESSGDLISREAVCDYIAEFVNDEYSTDAECEMVDAMIEGIQHLPPVNPQEPFINKPCISESVCHEDKVKVLDKIRAEIEDLDRFYDNDYFSGNRDSMFKCNEVMQIIDKYREGEEV